MAVIGQHSKNAFPLRAHGQCLLQYYAEGKKYKENFPVKLWVNPPDEIYLQGDVAFDPKGLVTGANKEEFWLAVKPKEISGYWYGKWSQGRCTEGLIINPAMILEGVGIMETVAGEQKNWALSDEGVFDVLIKKSGNSTVKKIYIFKCDYQVARIEYFNAAGQMVLTTELDKYEEIGEDFSVPAIIKIVRHTENKPEDSVSVRLSLKGIRPAEFTEQMKKRLFVRPEPKGFDNIHRVTGD